MSKPKPLKIFDEEKTSIAYSKLVTYAESASKVSTSYGNMIKLSGITSIQNKSLVSFIAPCNSEEVDKLFIGTNSNDNYSILDASGNSPYNSFKQGESIIMYFNTEDKKAYIVNGAGSRVTQKRITYGTKLPTTGNEGDIFLLIV